LITPPYDIRVNAIAPGPTRTDLIRDHLRQNPAAKPHITGRILVGRLAEPEEIAVMALFLLSAEARFCAAPFTKPTAESSPTKHTG
jgi:NAD(P)-dependent dehydrogenase (short-subunit alcohol dehydrogenase family)